MCTSLGNNLYFKTNIVFPRTASQSQFTFGCLFGKSQKRWLPTVLKKSLSFKSNFKTTFSYCK